MTAILLALDLATNTGWCLMDEAGAVTESGVVDLSRGNKKASKGERLSNARRWLKVVDRRLCALTTLTTLAYERPHFRGYDPTLLLAGLVGQALLFAHNRGLYEISIHSGTLKKEMTGNGRASKAQVIEAAQRYVMHKRLTDDNEADAIGVARTAYSVIMSS